MRLGRAVAGVFVGGASRRMGGSPKGLLRLASGEVLVDRVVRLLRGLGVDAVLVGARPEYAPRRMLADAIETAGPVGGLIALLRHVAALPETAAGPAWALVVACDMPHVSEALVGHLLDAPEAVAVAPRRGDRWEPMLARYDARRALPVVMARAARGANAMQGLLDELGATPLLLSETEARELDDWDTLDDMMRRPA